VATDEAVPLVLLISASNAVLSDAGMVVSRFTICFSNSPSGRSAAVCSIRTKADNFADHAFDRVKSLHIAVRRERSQNWSATVPQTPASILNEAIVTGMIVLC